jgi:putative transposase
MIETMTFDSGMPGVSRVDREVVNFREQFEGRDVLDQLARQGAQQMLQQAIETEVQEFLDVHQQRRDNDGNRLVVRNGHKPSRKILTGAGALEVQQPRVRDNSPCPAARVQFRSAILPPYLRRSKAIEEFIPWLYLKGISTGDFSEALQTLLGERTKGLSPNVIVRLKEQWTVEYEAWNRRDLTGKHYVYFWADGIHVNVRLEDTENKQQCLLVVMGATAEGHKELLAN